MMKNLLLRGALMVAVTLLAACAQSPQRINVAPTVTLSGDMTGNGRAIIVTASDQRASKELGSLGGVYGSTAKLTIANNLEQALTQAANGLLAAQGYVVNSPDPSALQLSIVVEKITYENIEQPVGSAVKLNATLRADVVKGGETFTGRYSTENERRSVTRPDVEDNEEYVNSLLSDTLKRMFADNRLREFLVK
jgi:uncharacterized lipoprotein